MTESTSTQNSTITQARSPAKKRTNPMVLLLMALVATAAFGAGYYFFQIGHPLAQNQALNSELVKQTVGLTGAGPLHMDESYRDVDDDLVADPPPPSQCINPKTIEFSYVAIEDPEKYKDVFSEFTAHLSKSTGKPVEYAVFKNPGEELRAMRDGKLHVAGFNTGNLPLAVNWAGFVPVCRLASADGGGMYQMEIIVPADSPISSINDLRGHEIVLTEAGSNSGFKAPLVVLHDHGLEPVRDFRIRYSGGHKESIQGIANKQYEAAAVANDILSREITDGNIKKEQFRSIYKSENFPTAGFGYVYNLEPELAKKVKDAMMSFKWEGTKVEKEFAASGQSKLVPVDYRNDWALVRRIDSEIRGTWSLQTLLEAPSESTTQPSESTSQPATQTAAATR